MWGVATEVQSARAQARESGRARGEARSERLLLIVALSAAGGVIHAKAFIDHAGHYWLFGAFFAVLTYAQVVWAVRVYRRPDDHRVMMAGAIGGLVIVGIWLVSRTVGLPFGPWAHRAEPVGIADVTASLDELVLAGLVFAMLEPRRWAAARLAWLDGQNCTRIGTALCALSLIATVFGQHTHPAVR